MSIYVICNHALPFFHEEMAKSKIATIVSVTFWVAISFKNSWGFQKNIMYFLLLTVFACIAVLLSLIIVNSRWLFSRLSCSNWYHCWGAWMWALPQWNVYTSKIRTWKSILGVQSVSRRFDINSSYSNKILHPLYKCIAIRNNRIWRNFIYRIRIPIEENCFSWSKYCGGLPFV